MMIKAILSNLKSIDKELLMYAFETGDSAYIQYASGRFIGVNLQPGPHLLIEKSEGRWSCGILETGMEPLLVESVIRT